MQVCKSGMLRIYKPIGIKIFKSKNIQNSNWILCFCFRFEDSAIDFFYNHNEELAIDSFHKCISNFNSLSYRQIRYLQNKDTTGMVSVLTTIVSKSVGCHAQYSKIIRVRTINSMIKEYIFIMHNKPVFKALSSYHQILK